MSGPMSCTQAISVSDVFALCTAAAMDWGVVVSVAWNRPSAVAPVEGFCRVSV
jgi:hypothetical protein